MAVERAKVLAALDTKFKGKSVSKNLKESLATKWAAKIDTDDLIDAFVDDREDVVLEASTEADRRVTEAVKKAKEEKVDPTKKPEPKTEELIDDPEMPAWFKAYAKQSAEHSKALTDKITGLEQSRLTETLAERFKKDDRLKGVPDFMLKRSTPTKEEDYEAAVTELQGDFTAFATENKLEKFGKDAPPGDGSNKQSKDQKLDPAIAAFAEKQVKAHQEQHLKT